MTPGKKQPRAWVNWIGFGILAVCYAGALWNVARLRKETATHEVIRLVHWQLELGVRDGLQDLIDRFEARKAAEGHPVKIIQIPMPERTYKQYVTTRLIGRNAPDMIQIGKFPHAYIGRYFRPLSHVLQQTNPFIEARRRELQGKVRKTEDDRYWEAVCADLKDRPWMDTFGDGLKSMFRDRFQEYYAVGFSMFTVRMFYNKKIFREALGTDEPPTDYREFLHTCERIRRYAATCRRDLVPIASSQFQMLFFKSYYLQAMTSDITIREDLDLDGSFSEMERVTTFLRGKSGPVSEDYRAGIELGRRLAQYFPPGFMALGRTDASFAFVQGKAAMTTTGSWDAKSFARKIEDQPEDLRFEFGVFELPMPEHDDPEFGKWFDGAVSESGHGTQFPFGVTRFSRHFGLCIEFLQFCTTPENNTRLNDHAAWIPSVIGAKMSPLLENFRPNYAGVWGAAGCEFARRGRGHTVERQHYWPFIQGQVDYETYSRNLLDKLPPAAAVDYQRLYQQKREGIPERNATRSAYLALAVFGGAQERADGAQERADNEKKLLRSWNTLAAQVNGERTYDAMMDRAKADIRKNEYRSEFNDRFFAELRRLGLEQ